MKLLLPEQDGILRELIPSSIALYVECGINYIPLTQFMAHMTDSVIDVGEPNYKAELLMSLPRLRFEQGFILGDKELVLEGYEIFNKEGKLGLEASVVRATILNYYELDNGDLELEHNQISIAKRYNYLDWQKWRLNSIISKEYKPDFFPTYKAQFPDLLGKPKLFCNSPLDGNRLNVQYNTELNFLGEVTFSKKQPPSSPFMYRNDLKLDKPLTSEEIIKLKQFLNK
jgi:hypothetical protein